MRIGLDIDNVIDMEVITSTLDSVHKIFMLTGDGSVYFYNLSDMLVEKYDVNKIDISNKVIHIFQYGYAPIKQAGGIIVLFAYTVDNKLIEIKIKI